MSTKADKQLGAVALKVREGYSNLWPKIRASLQYVYKHHFQNYDWFLKADDDTCVVIARNSTRRNDSEACESVPGTKRREITVENSSASVPISQGNEEKNPAASLAPKTPEIFLLNTYCWERVISYLSVGDQLRLAASSPHLKSLFETLSLKYKRITENVAWQLSENELSQLLEIVNENVISYESPLGPHFDGERNLWLLRTFCPRLEHLKISIERPRWNDLLQLKSLTSLHVYLQFSRAKMFKHFVRSLAKLPCLRKLNLKAPGYSGDGLHVLENLESLAFCAYKGLNAKCLATACLKMKQLRHLDFGEFIETLTADHLRVIVRNCRNLESLLLAETFMPKNVPYEILCQLPKLKYLKIWHSGFLEAGFIEGLIHKTDTPLESLILKGDVLRAEQVEHICEISSLRELFIRCYSVPLSGLLKLRNLEILKLDTSEITNHQLLTILEGCPLIRVLGLSARLLINSDFVRDATRLFGCRKIKIYLQVLYVNRNILETLNGNRFIQFELAFLD
ncbi:uncharacterized protein LOC108092291 [Drosophila ficusphila]|uniref:uncharacterized protein LOC108092291 n=1 Tax=Drosophila ficusphila TaxID=30025 RepID=UPI001C89B28D|nr:uncharacterized protein LOC108092291 [Drosophila ficusphila]